MTRKCKTCGRTVGQYAYGGGNGWRTHYEQRVGKTSKDRWLQATSQFGSEYREDEKKSCLGISRIIQMHMLCFVEPCVWKHTWNK